ncbi:translocation/assembly module TamB domain-containing protein [Sagittula sp. SSi028]|uniref:translocation/assembly module TamB domain-containing protein n=1 Tax=Sagittula sp. SSi028 TaxID=3400636 RepID=UPI003AF5DFF4
MRKLLLCLCVLWPLAAAAQDDDDRGFIQGLLEDALSNDNMTVRLEGFAGALSSRATVDRITIADPQGIWLEAEDVGLQWNRSALARGRVDIEEISMQSLSLPRLPNAPEETPTPEAKSSFALPDLPVALILEQLSVAEVTLGAPVIGEAAVLSVTGSASLAGGEGAAQLEIERLDRGGTIALDGSYANDSRVLGLDLEVTEPEGGLVVTALQVPDAPSMALTLKGEAPLDDFEAALTLATDGQERISGDIILRADGDAGTNRFRLDIGGDLAALVDSQYDEFLGDDVALVAEVLRDATGEVELNELRLQSDALLLNGYARIGADGWPEQLDLTGEITPPSGETVVLPFGGGDTRVQAATLAGTFDASAGNGWTLRAEVDGLDRDNLGEMDRVVLSGAGEILRDTQAVSGDLDLQLQGIALDDPALAEAVGPALRGQLGFDWQSATPLILRDIDLTGGDYGLTGQVTLDGLEAMDLRVIPDLVVKADNLSRFATLAGVALDGAAELSLTGEAAPLTGAFDIVLDGTTRALETGIERVDPLLEGVGTARLEARRDDTGLYAELLRIVTQAARIDGTAQLASGAGQADLDIALRDSTIYFPGVEAQTDLSLKAVQEGDLWRINLDGTIPEVADLTYDGTVNPSAENGPAVDGLLVADVGRLSAFSDLAGRSLAGAALLRVEGEGRIGAQQFDAEVSARGVDVSVGLDAIDPLLENATDLGFDLRRGTDGVFVLENLGYDRDGGGEITLDGTVSGTGVEDLAVDGRLLVNDVRLQPLSGLAGRALSGSVDADLAASGQVLDGPLDLRGSVTGQGLRLSVPAADSLLAGTTRVNIDATRDAEGVIDVQQLAVSGPLEAGFTGTVAGLRDGQLQIDGQAQGNLPRLSVFNGLSGQSLSGSASFDTAVNVVQPDGPVAVSGNLTAQGLGIGNASLDPFLAGRTDVALNVQRDAGGALRIERLTVDGASIDGSVSGQLASNASNLSLQLSVAGLERLVRDLPGTLRVSGTAAHSGGDWRVDLDGSGPGGIGAQVNGTVAQNFATMNLGVTGTAPLALANGRLAPNVVEGLLNVDVAVNGAPALENVSGRLSTSGARFSATALDQAVNDLTGGVTLSGGRAEIDMRGELASGGRVAATGPVVLSDPYGANLVITLDDAVLRQDDLFETTADGRITVEGPLTGGARIAGQIDLGQVDVSVPSIGPSYSALDGLRHEDMPADVRQTLLFAGLEQTADTQATASTSRPYPLDVQVNAPSRIFVRGRGLDAELGGSLRLTGTTADIVPVGQFDLVRGRLDLLGRRLDLTEGSVSMRGSFTPIVNFAATTEVEDTTITISLSGEVTEPELEVTASPDMPEDEALAFFLFGTSVTNLSPLQAVQLAAAIRTLSGQGGLGIQDSIRSDLGVDDLDIGTNDDGTVEASVGKYLSDNVYTDVTVGADGGSEVNLNLTLTPNVTVRGRVGSDGDSGLGVFFEKDY